jgi:hypothetical protein
MSNIRQIGMAEKMYAQDYGGYYAGSWYNWAVNTFWPTPQPFLGKSDINKSPLDSKWGGSYNGWQFSKCLHDLLSPFIKDDRVWICPSDKLSALQWANTIPMKNAPIPANGCTSYVWFPQWHFNLTVSDNGSATEARIYPDTGKPKYLSAPCEADPYVSERMLFGENWGVYGWDGPADQDGPAAPASGYLNHQQGVNEVYADGHAKFVTWAQRMNTVPDTYWDGGLGY